jgi:nickel-type superoxide dismutase maturation protease
VAVRWVERFARRVEVVGPSMVPTLLPGQRVTALKRWRRVRDGDIVVVADPTQPERWLVKRVRRRDDGRVDLVGDNAEFSTDSRHFGPVEDHAVRYIVLRSSLR